MKLNLLAGAVLASGLTLSTWAQPAVVISRPPVQDGSNASRAPLPTNRPSEYSRVTATRENSSLPADAILAANHIGGATSDQIVAEMTPPVPAAQVYVATTPVGEPVVMATVPTARYSDVGQTIRINKDIRTAKINDQNVVVGTIEGRVTLRGWVDTNEDKRRIGEIAIAASSFELVDNQIQVGNPVTGS